MVEILLKNWGGDKEQNPVDPDVLAYYNPLGGFQKGVRESGLIILGF